MWNRKVLFFEEQLELVFVRVGCKKAPTIQDLLLHGF